MCRSSAKIIALLEYSLVPWKSNSRNTRNVGQLILISFQALSKLHGYCNYVYSKLIQSFM